MKSRAIFLTAVAFTAAALATTCTAPFSPHRSSPGGVAQTPAETGSSVVVRVPSVSSHLREALGFDSQETITPSRDGSFGSRALLFATGVEIRVYDASDALIRSVVSEEQAARRHNVEIGDLPTGTDLYLEVDVHNSTVDPSLVVMGTSEVFSLYPGQQHSLTVTCTPNPAATESLPIDTPDSVSLRSAVLDLTVGPIGPAGEAWYSLVAATDTLLITADSDPDASAVLYLYDQDGEMLSVGVRQEEVLNGEYGGSVEMRVPVTPDEVYYVGLILVSDSHSSYAATVEWADGTVEADEDEPNDDFADATPLSLPVAITRSLHTTTDVDHYAVELAAGTFYACTVPESYSGPGPYATLYDGTEAEISVSAGHANAGEDTLTFGFEPETSGTYYLVLATVDDFVGDYELSAGEPQSGTLATLLDYVPPAAPPGFADADLYYTVTPVDGDPVDDAVATGSGVISSTVGAIDQDTGQAWLGAGGAHDVHFLIDMDASGGASPTAGDFYGVLRVVVDGDTVVDLAVTFATFSGLNYYLQPDVYEPDDSFALAKEVVVDAPPQERTLNPDPDYAYFVSDGTSAYTLSIEGIWGETTLHVYDSDQTEILSETVTTGFLGHSVIWEAGDLGAGSYYLMIDGMGEEYTLEVTSP